MKDVFTKSPASVPVYVDGSWKPARTLGQKVVNGIREQFNRWSSGGTTGALARAVGVHGKVDMEFPERGAFFYMQDGELFFTHQDSRHAYNEHWDGTKWDEDDLAFEVDPPDVSAKN